MTSPLTEAQRQQQLLAAIWREPAAEALAAAWRGGPEQVQAGLAAYRGNATAIAERALGSAFPTVAQLLGQESFAGLARDYWRHHPPECGDLGEWGAALPAFIADAEALASEAYLANSARLDWLVHKASRADNGPDAAPDLAPLATADAAALGLALRPGCALLASAWPVASIWAAHQVALDPPADRFATVREALQAGRGEQALVWRDGYAVRVTALEPADAAFTHALLAGLSLAAALDGAGTNFAFDRWLGRALASRWLAGLLPL